MWLWTPASDAQADPTERNLYGDAAIARADCSLIVPNARAETSDAVPWIVHAIELVVLPTPAADDSLNGGFDVRELEFLVDAIRSLGGHGGQHHPRCCCSWL